MSTLQQQKQKAFDLGYADAKLARVYRDSFSPGDLLRDAGLAPAYELGWRYARLSNIN